MFEGHRRQFSQAMQRVVGDVVVVERGDDISHFKPLKKTLMEGARVSLDRRVEVLDHREAKMMQEVARSEDGFEAIVFGERSQAFNDELRASPFFRR